MTNAISIAQYGSSNPTFRNRIINGKGDIWQRGSTFSSINNNITYGSDRFFGFTTSSTAQAQILRSTSVPSGFYYSQQFGRASGNTAVVSQWLCQCIESWNMSDLSGQVVTVSFWAKAGANYSGGNLSIILSTGTTADQSSATFSAGPCTGYTGNQTAINTTQAITTTWTKYTFVSSSIQSGALSMGLGIGYTPTGTAGADDNIYITGVQLEAGTTASPFEYRQYGTELALCQRYLPSYIYSSSSGTETVAWVRGGSSASIASTQLPFTVTTRVPPTGATISGSYAVSGYSFSTLAFNNASTTNASISLSGGSGMTVFYMYELQCSTAGSKILFTGCEL